MKKMNYYEMLAHPSWQKKRLEILNLHGFACDACGNTEETLHVHHGYYDKNLKLWEYENNTLHCYCATHHQEIHEYQNLLKKALGAYDLFFLGATPIVEHFNFFVNLSIDLEIETRSTSKKDPCINKALLKSYKDYIEAKHG